MSAKQVIVQLHELAKEPEKAAVIMQDKACLPGILLFLDSPDLDTVHIAIDTMRLLSEIESNQPLLAKEQQVMLGIKKVLENPLVPPATKQLAGVVFKNIHHPQKPKPSPASTPDKKTTADGHDSQHTGSARKQGKGATTTPQQRSFLNVGGRPARLFTLYVPGVSLSENKKIAEEALLKVKGLVSFTFNTREEYVVVRALDTVPPAKFASAIAATGTLKAKQVLKGEDGKDMFVEMNEEGATPALKTDDDGYLDEDDTPYEKELSGTALARINDGRNAKGGWFGGIGNFIAKSLYW